MPVLLGRIELVEDPIWFDMSVAAMGYEANGGRRCRCSFMLTGVLSVDLCARIDEAVSTVVPDLIALRRSIHRRPELAGQEVATAAMVAECLDAAGLDVSIGVGGHGVVGILDGASPGPTVAYRADMDAVAMDEESDAEFRSQVPGAAHLCGHDIHTAIGVGIARVLAGVRQDLAGRVVLFFQPAEEKLAGAQAMIGDGALEGVNPREIYALHSAHGEVGTFAVMPGAGLPGRDSFDLELDGPDAADKAAAIAERVRGWTTVRMPRTEAEHQRLWLDMQVENGPLASFVYASAGPVHDTDMSGVRLSGWVKAWPDDAYAIIRSQVTEVVREVCGPDALSQLRFAESVFPAMISSPDLSNAAAKFFGETFGPDAVIVLRTAFPFNEEDFALFLNRIPGAMFFLGVANPAAGISGLVHTPTFAADERAIGNGTRAMANWLAIRLAALADGRWWSSLGSGAPPWRNQGNTSALGVRRHVGMSFTARC